MSLFDRFRKKKELERLTSAPSQKAAAVKEQPAVDQAPSSGDSMPKKLGGEPHRVLLYPLQTEKSSFLSALGKYAFAVSPDANKVMVKKAVENVYGVKVRTVNMMNYQGKEVRYGRFSGRRRHSQKAIVTLAKGEQIQLHSKV